MSDANLPAPLSPDDVLGSMASLPVSLQIFFNDALFERCKAVAHYLAKAEGMAPRHLIGKPEACFAVISRALTWRLDPYAVAQATYQTPNGQVGYYGSLCQAIIENSGRLTGGVKFQHYGDWERLRGRFKIVTGERGGKYPSPDWKPEAEDGLGVEVSAQLTGEDERRVMRFDLIQAYPRNSTLWATDPRTQIQYTAVRRFATSTVPTLFMGVPFDHEDMDWAASLTDVTPPRPEPEEFAETGQRRRGRQRTVAAPAQAATPAPNGEAKDLYFFADPYGEIKDFPDADAAVAGFAEALEGGRGNPRVLEAFWENGARLIAALRDHGRGPDADALSESYRELIDEADAQQRQQTVEGQRQPQAPAEAAGEPKAEAAAEEGQAAEASPASAQQAGAGEYDVAVPLGQGQSLSQWHMAARARLKQMTEAQRPATDFQRFRAANKDCLDRLHGELRSWFNMLDREITKGASAT